jgi:tetratricopeptide (TPR) repeat protein
VRSARIARKLSFTAVLLGALGMFGLAGCELLLAGGAAIYSKAHGPDRLSNAFVSLRRDDCSSSDSEFAAILAAEPNNPQANYGRADALVCLGKYNDAIGYYSLAIKLDPKWFQYLGRGLAYKAQGDQKQALNNFNEGIAIGPTVPALYIYRGAVLSAQGDASSARADFEKVSHLISDQPWRFNSYAWALATSPVAAYRDGPAAIGYSRRACELTSWKSAPELDTLAAAYAEAGQFNEALKWQTTAIQLDAHPSEAYEARLARYQKREAFHSDRPSVLFF